MKRSLDWIFPAVLVTVVLGLYGRTVGFDFIDLDDRLYIHDLPWVRSGPSLEGIRQAFFHPVGSVYIPLVILSFMVEAGIHGLWAGGFHLTNTMFHLANVLLLFVVFKKMSGRMGPSFFAAALFAVHPLHVESVAWIAERKDVLCAFFFLLTLWAYERWVRGSSWRAYLVAMVCFLAALLSKPSAVSLPVCLLLLDYWPLNRVREPGGSEKIKFQRLGRLVWEKTPFFVMAGLFSLMALCATPSELVKVDLNVLPFEARLENALVSYATYLGKLAVPRNLAVLYPHPGVGLPWGILAISAAVLTALTVAAVFLRKKAPWLLTGWFWYLIVLLPVIGLVQVGPQAMADRFVYIPFWGLYWAIGWTGMVWLDRGLVSRKALWIAGTVVLTVFSLTAWRQIGYWRDGFTLFVHAAQVTRNNWRMENNVASILIQQGDLSGAKKHLALAWKAGPDEALTHFNLGFLYMKMGERARAEYHIRQVLALNPDYPKSHFYLGTLLAQRGKWASATKELEIALSRDGPSASLYAIMGQVHVAQGNIDLASKYLKKALSLEPGHAAAARELQKIETEVKHE